MDAVALRTFVDVARMGNFAQVAREHELDPSSISRTIAALEDELGVRLFQRTTRKLALTEAGHLYLARVAPLVDELEHAREEALAVSRGATGTLRMTSSVSFGILQVAPLLKEFRAQHPQLKVELLLSDANLNLVNDRIDLAIRLGAQIEGDAVITRLMRTRYRVCASPGYIAQHGAPKKPADLSAHRCLLLSIPEFRHEWHFKSLRGKDMGEVQSVPIDGDVVISSPLALRDCAIADMGPALLTNWLVNPALAEGTLIDLFPHHHVTATSFDTGVWLMYPSRSYLPLKVRVMVDFLKTKLGDGAV
jgi:DNA-binding transcriptional LysR family regulator